jgi:hypothetical protein
MEENWELKHTKSINQMLRIRDDVIPNNHLGTLMVIKHEYHIADDIMFPDPACLAFFAAFEENHLSALEKEGELKLIAVDIFQGDMKFYIYCHDAQKCIYACIEYLKSNTNFPVDFEIKEDRSWSTYEQLTQMSV